MGGLKLPKPVEIIEVPKVSEGIKLDISLRLSERPILQPVPEPPGATGGFFPTADPKMAITPNLQSTLQSNPGAKLHMELKDLNKVMEEDGTGRNYLTHQMIQSPPNSKMMSAFAVTFGVLGVVMIPGMASWMLEHGDSILGFMGLPLFGMVMGGVAKETAQSGRITRYRDLERFHEDYWKLDASGGEPKTIKWEGMEEGVGYHHKIFTIGTLNRLGEEIKIDVETSSETDQFHRGPDWRFYDMTIYSAEELGSQSEQLAEDFFSTTLVIHTTDPATVETIHQQFVAEYQRTGSAQVALDWLMNSPWGSAMFELQETRIGAPKVETISGAEQKSLVANIPGNQERRSGGFIEWLLRRMGSEHSWGNYLWDMERAGNIPEAKKAHEKIIGLSLKQAQKFESWTTQGRNLMFEVGKKEKDYAEFLERQGLFEQASLHYEAAAEGLRSKGELTEWDRYLLTSAMWKAYKISVDAARKAERRGDFLNAGILFERAGRNVLPSDYVPREFRGKWSFDREMLLNFAKAALSFKKAGDSHWVLFEGVLKEIEKSPRSPYAGEKWVRYLQELIEYLRRNDSNLPNANRLITRGPQQ